MRTLKISLLICVGILVSSRSFAATPDEITQQRLYQEQQTQQYERERSLRQLQEPKPDVRLQNVPTGNQIQPAIVEAYPANETPCFLINHIELVGELSSKFNFALKDVTSGKHNAIGKCLGVVGINNVLTRVQNSIIAKGFVTTRVLASPQNLKSGTLQLTIIPGRVHAIRFSPEDGHYGARWNAFPMNVGDVLNLRDIEQALENFKRIPTVEADIQIEPSIAKANDAVRPGDSDLVVRYQQSKPFRISLNADDAGVNSTGKYQGGITVSADNLFMLNDLAYLNFNHDLGGGDDGKRGTHGYTAHYSIPWDYWLLSATVSDNKYFQSVAGATQTYIYSGTSQNTELELNHLVYRDATTKVGISIGSFIKSSQNFIDDAEIDVQRRRTAGWLLGANYSQYFGQSSLEVQAQYKHGTGAFNALPAPEENFGEGTSRFRLFTTNVYLNVPFSVNAPWGTQPLQYSSTVRAQWNDTPLTPQDRFSIGNRYTVRGFDGQLTLAADRGWLIRNDLSAPISRSGQALYLGLDYGEVGGQASDNLIGKYLAGAAVGLRGNGQATGLKALNGFSYDVFLSKPISKPKGFETHDIAAGFNLNYSY